jgi:hypothetical protein
MLVIPSILSGLSLYLPLLIRCPRYLTSSSTNCNLVFENFSPWWPRKLRRLTVTLVTSFSVSPDNRRPSTCYNKFIWGERENSSSTHSKIWLNNFGESVKLWRTVHLYCCFVQSGSPPIQMQRCPCYPSLDSRLLKSTTLKH